MSCYEVEQKKLSNKANIFQAEKKTILTTWNILFLYFSDVDEAPLKFNTRIKCVKND